MAMSNVSMKFDPSIACIMKKKQKNLYLDLDSYIVTCGLLDLTNQDNALVK